MTEADRKPLTAAEHAARRRARLSPPRCAARSASAPKPLASGRDLSLAYSPGVAYACLAIEENRRSPPGTPRAAISSASSPTARRCSGSGDIGPLAGKPVMEGKGACSKKFAGIDVFDIELAGEGPGQARRGSSPRSSRRWAASISRTSRRPVLHHREPLKDRLKIPVFHDDQHGTAIISAPRSSTAWNSPASSSAP